MMNRVMKKNNKREQLKKFKTKQSHNKLQFYNRNKLKTKPRRQRSPKSNSKRNNYKLCSKNSMSKAKPKQKMEKRKRRKRKPKRKKLKENSSLKKSLRQNKLKLSLSHLNKQSVGKNVV